MDIATMPPWARQVRQHTERTALAGSRVVEKRKSWGKSDRKVSITMKPEKLIDLLIHVDSGCLMLFKVENNNIN